MVSWTQEQENGNWEPAVNIVDAKLEQDLFQEKYDQYYECHQGLVVNGRMLASEICRLEKAMFGAVENDHTHPVVWEVELTVGRLEEVCGKMETVVGPWLQELRDCYQFYHIKETASQVCNIA